MEKEQDTKHLKEKKPFNLKEKSLDFSKGAAIGVACLIPGVSGGTIAVLLKIYQKIINSVNNIYKHFGKAFMSLLPIVLGIIIAIVLLTNPIKWAFEKLPLPLICLFVGLIVGGMPELLPFVKRKLNVSGSVSFILACALIVGLCFVPSIGDVDISSVTLGSFVFIFFMGILAASALVVPGISGSMMMLVFGFYYPLLSIVSNLMKFNSGFGYDVTILLIFVFGLIVGFLVISKLMGFLLKKYKYQTYMGIIGFIVGSLFALFYQFNPNSISPLEIFTDVMPQGGQIALAIVMGVIGLVASFGIVYLSNKKVQKEAVVKNEIR